jgi:hypothetical protein
MCLIAAVPAAVIGVASAPLTAAGAGLAARERAGAELLVVLIACGVLLVLGGRRAIAFEGQVKLTPARRRAVLHGLAAACAAPALAAILVLAFSARGLDGTVSHAWHSFTTTRTAGVYDPGRLVSADSENRWGWWKEAAGAISARPLQGWGAGSFGVTHLLYRRDTLSVQQPHSVPLQFLAETGIVGAALALGALALLLATAARALRLTGGRARPAVVALLAAAAASACLAVFAVSAVAPRLAASDADRALVAASGTGRPALRFALARALASSRIDPLSDAGLRAASTIALREGIVRLARRLLATAVRRQPTDGQAWQQLTLVDLVLGERGDAVLAARRGLALDPRGPLAATVAQRTVLALTPPAGSATSAPAVRAGGG